MTMLVRIFDGLSMREEYGLYFVLSFLKATWPQARFENVMVKLGDGTTTTSTSSSNRV